MSGLEVNVVGNLAELLRDRYGRGAGELQILKELVQNADDAGATEQNFILLETGFDGAKNSLLHGPALVSVNDGAFKAEDENAIKFLGLTSKAGDHSKIGRFGLGQKSVFHLAEAYLYLGREGESPMRADVIDPWQGLQGDLENPDWTEFAPDERSWLRQLLSPWTTRPNWFALYLPLRTEKHRRAAGGVITQHFPDVVQLRADLADLSQLGALLPQLHAVQKIASWTLPANGLDATLLGEASAGSDFAPLSRPLDHKVLPFSRRFGGAVNVIAHGATRALRAWGHEKLVADRALDDLRADHKTWPTRVTDQLSGTSTPEKALQHGGVTVLVSDGEEPGLQLTWAVFLPLSADAEDIEAPRLRHRWRIWLHGYFFPDSGRRVLAATRSTSEREKDPRAAWNARLRDTATLPCLLEALAPALEAVDPDEGELLAIALVSSAVWKSHGNCVSGRFSLAWGPVATSDAAVVHNQPRRIASKCRLLLLRRPVTDDLSKLGDVLRAWLHVEAAGDVVLVWADSPIIGSSHGRPSPWGMADIEEALARLEPQHLSRRPTALRYIVDALKDVSASCPGASVPILALLRRCFREAALTVGNQNNEWTRLAALTAPGALMWSAAKITLLRELAREPTDVLFLPQELRPVASPVRSDPMSLGDARTMLRALSSKLDDAQARPDAATLIAEIVASVSPNAVLRDAELSTLPLFRVWSARANGDICVKATTLGALMENGRAFRGNPVGATLELARKMLACFDDDLGDVVLVRDDSIADALSVSAFDETTLARAVLSSSARLAGPERRHEFFRHIALGRFALSDLESRARTNFEVRSAVRLLVHGSREHAVNDAPLLLAVATDEAFAELAVAVLGPMGHRWRVVPALFDDSLATRGWRDALRIYLLDHDMLVALMANDRGAWRLDIGTQLERTLCVALRDLLVRKRSDDLFGSLAIHETNDGAVVSSGEPGVYLERAWPVPESLSAHVRLICRADDPATRDAQERSIRPVWSPEEQVTVCLDRGPQRFTREVLDAIGAFRPLPDALRLRLQTAAWLPTADGGWTSPADVLNVAPAIDAAVRVLLGDAKCVFLAPSKIHSAARHHPAFASVCQDLALNGGDALAAMAEQLDEHIVDGANRFWVLPPESRGRERDFLERGLSSACLRSDPTWHFLAALDQNGAAGWLGERHARALFDALRREPDNGRLTGLLVRFRDEKGLNGDEREQHRLLFEDYLRYARTREDFVPTILPRIFLMNTNATWRATQEIAAFDSHLQDQFRLHTRHRDIIGAGVGAVLVGASRARNAARPRPTPDDLRQAPTTLQNYFSTWSGIVSTEAIGYFLACLGDGTGGGVGAVAEQYLQPARTVTGAREKLLFGMKGREVSIERDGLVEARWAIDVVDEGDEREVLSLAGTILRAKVTSSGAGGIFVGEIPVASGHPEWLRLRRVDARDRRAGELHGVLGESVVGFLESAISVPLPRTTFDPFWDALARGGQSQVNAVRSLILDQLEVHIDRLVGRRDELFRGVCLRLDRAEQRVREVKENGGIWDAARAQVEDERRLARDALRSLVENDDEAQRRLVRAVRAKLADAQYTVEQVVFELFQNADDAAAELLEQRRGREPGGEDPARDFAVEVERTPPLLRVQHWGRPINRRSGDAASGAARGFELDLKNMLLLNYSDKDHRSTGRFGLGFKSVHLLTHAPRVRSGDLSFEVRGGLLPRHIPHDGLPDISTQLNLPLDDGSLVDRALSRFVVCAGLLPVFATAIRRVSLKDGLTRYDCCWNPALLGGHRELETGSVSGLTGRARTEPTRLLVVRGTGVDERYTAAFHLGSVGVEAFANHPEIWCTAPTLERWGIGFCLNGPFVLDVGRGQLARGSAENVQCFVRLGRILGEGLVKLSELLESNFTATAQALGLESGVRSPDVVRRDFWRAMFDQLTQFTAGDEASDRTESVWAMHQAGGLGALVAGRRVLPTDLPGAHDVLTTASEIKWVLEDVIARPEIFQTLSALGWLSTSLAPGTAVTTRVSRRLARVGVVLRPPPPTLGFAALLQRSLPADSLIGPEHARKLRQLWRNLENAADLPAQSLEALRGVLSSARFRTRSGKPRKPSDILVGRELRTVVAGLDGARHHDMRDELMRSEFAPDEHVLDAAYGDRDALELFLFARQRLVKGSAVDMARWARDAASAELRWAVMAYLAGGEWSERVIAEIKERGGLPWCAMPSELAVVTERLDVPAEVLEVLRLRLFGLGVPGGMPLYLAWDEEDDSLASEPSQPQRPVDPGPVLRDVAAWWRRQGAQWEKRYNEQIYGCVPRGDFDAFVSSLRAGQREAWTLMLTLAACQRLGRQTDAQHGGFVRHLRATGSPKWWSIVAGDPASTKPDMWMRMLDQWLDQRVDSDPYRVWLGLFPTLYQIHRHGDLYRRLLVSADHGRLAQVFSLESHLAPRANAAFAGAGRAFDGPPLAPALGIGATWLLRELVRLKVVPAAAHLAPFCYVPRGPTRVFLQRLGAPEDDPSSDHEEKSQSIHRFVRSVLDDAATFGGAFDLPLHLYAIDPAARAQAET